MKIVGHDEMLLELFDVVVGASMLRALQPPIGLDRYFVLVVELFYVELYVRQPS